MTVPDGAAAGTVEAPDLVGWLAAQYDAEEAKARAAWGDDEPDAPRVWTDPWGEFHSRGGELFDHILAHDPDRVLCEVAAKRRIVDLCVAMKADMSFAESGGGLFPGDEKEMAARVLMLLALPYADRPGYRESWRPSECDDR